MRTVLLRHDLRDGTSHYDWMIQRPAVGPGSLPEGSWGATPGAGPLLTFRITCRIDRGGGLAFRAEQIQDHRPDYLTYEGEISGGRGSVARIAGGEVEFEWAAQGELVLTGRLGAAVGVFRGIGSGDLWQFTFEPAPLTGPTR